MDSEGFDQSDNPDRFHQGLFSGPDLQGLDVSDLEADGVDASTETKVTPLGIAADGSNFLHVFEPESYDRALETSWTRLETAHNLKFPWESGVWDFIFGSSSRSSCLSLPSFSRPAVVPRVCTLDVPAPAEKRRRVEEVPQTWHQVVMSSDAATWREANDAKMDTALKRWFDVVILFPTSFQLVAQLAEMPTVGEQMRMMRDVLGSKSPLTLLKRVNSIILYTSFLQLKGVTAPGSEADFYAFLNNKGMRVPPSRDLQL